MKKISYRPVYNRKKKLNAQGTALLQVEAYLKQKKVYFSTQIYLRPEQWDKRKKQIIKHPNAEALNYMLSEFIIILEQKEIELWKNGFEITLERLKEEMSTSEGLSFQQYVYDSIMASPSKPSTRKNKLTTLALLNQYRPSLSFRSLTSSFIHNFESFLYEKGHKTNTVTKHMKHLRSFINSAIDRGYISQQNYPFQRYKTKRVKGKTTHLLPEEVQKLEKLALTGKTCSLSHTLDAFLFCSYTGLRYSDFINLTEKNIVFIQEKPWLILTTIKTGADIKLPLTLLFNGKAWKILQKHKGHWNSFFRLKTNSTVNKELIRIGKLANIEKHFSFHSSRHTCATLLVYHGVNITTVQKLLGHRNVATTQIYSEIMESTVVNDLKRCAKEKQTNIHLEENFQTKEQ